MRGLASLTVKHTAPLDKPQQAIDTTTPMGKLVFQVAGAFAEFERTMIRQRVDAGRARKALRHRGSDPTTTPLR
jgi:DNA invertase Pin-like site-specific DNA recombinase